MDYSWPRGRPKYSFSDTRGDPKAGTKELREVKLLLEACGARTKTQDLAADQARESLNRLDRLELPNEIKQSLASLIATLTGRDS